MWRVHPSYIPIDEELLGRLYVEEGLTIVQVSHQLGVGATTVSRRLRGLGIRARPRGPAPGFRRTSTRLEWTPDLACAVGLIATDGNLSRRAGRLSIMSNDADLLDMVRRRLDLTVPIVPHRGGYGHRCQRIAWSDRRLYDWLLAIGLTPAKSLTIGPLAIPNDYFPDFFRGCIDGDGSIVTYVDHYNTFKNPAYVYTRLYVSLVSASALFLKWIRATVHTMTGASGDMTVRRTAGRNDLWRLRYAKAESLRLLRWMYYAPNVPSLARKREIAAAFLPVQSPRRDAVRGGRW